MPEEAEIAASSTSATEYISDTKGQEGGWECSAEDFKAHTVPVSSFSTCSSTANKRHVHLRNLREVKITQNWTHRKHCEHLT